AAFPLVVLLLLRPSRERSILLAILLALAAALPFAYGRLLSLYLALGGSQAEVTVARFVSAAHTPAAAASMTLLFPVYAAAALVAGFFDPMPEFPSTETVAVAVVVVTGVAGVLIWSDAGERRRVLAFLVLTL